MTHYVGPTYLTQFVRNWRRCLVHVPVGLVNVWLHTHSKVLSVIFAIGFLFFYELVEDWHLRDDASIDVQGYLIGLIIYAVWYYEIVPRI